MGWSVLVDLKSLDPGFGLMSKCLTGISTPTGFGIAKIRPPIGCRRTVVLVSRDGISARSF